MEFLDRITAVLHHENPDQVPFAPYDNLVPRGSFARELRNRGMGLLLRRPAVWSERPNVRVETTTQGDIRTTTYYTPAGSLSTRHKLHVSRQYSEGRTVEVEGLIKGKADIDAAIFMIGDTVYHVDDCPYEDTTRDVGGDGLVRVTGCGPAYDEVIGLFGIGTAEGLSNWVYTQADYPDHFAELLKACERDNERLLPLVADSPAEFIALGSLNGFYNPDHFRQYALPFYREAASYLHSRGKICSIHAHAPRLQNHKELLRETGIDVVEAFTPPPYGDLSVAEARKAWGPDKVIWANFPETVFYSGYQATKQYTIDILRSDAPGRSLVIGFTESGLACIVDDEVERIFKDGFMAIMEAIEQYGSYPVQ